MIKIHILTIGELKASATLDLYHGYQKRMDWSVFLHEYRDHKKLLSKIDQKKPLWVLDERGDSLKSAVFAQKIQGLTDEGYRDLQFVIGGADGLPDEIRKSADKLLCFGKQTWPHMLARVMLMEQLYRAQQILKGHPYHRE